MAGLPKLADGWYYASAHGHEVMDDRGNWYAVEYQAPTPQVSIPTPEKVKDWRADLPTVALSPEAFDLIKALKEGMAVQPVEHFLAVGIDICGDPCFEDWQKGDEIHCTVDVDRIVTKARESKAVGVACYHNHPYPYEATMSAPDKQLTALLERKLAKEYITLHEHAVVKGRPPAEAPRFSESGEPPTLWELDQLKESTLWRAYGGSNPYRR
jgi:hypothetical protein